MSALKIVQMMEQMTGFKNDYPFSEVAVMKVREYRAWSENDAII